MERHDVSDSSNGLSETPPKGFGERHIQMALIYMGLINSGILFFSLSIALVGMDDTTGSSGPVVNYTLADQGIISGLFVFGYMVGVIPSGYLTTVYDPMRLWSFSGILSGVLQILFPLIAINLGFTTTCLSRTLLGLLQSITGSAQFVHFSRWVPNQEKVRYSSIWGGKELGFVAILMISGLLMSYIGGWPSIFYLCGVFSVVWGMISLFWSAESPSTHPTITTVEKEFLKANTTIERKTTIKWKALLTSVPVWTVVVGCACNHWTDVIIASFIPTFFNKVLNISVNNVAFLTAGLYLSYILSSYGCAFLANKLSEHVSPKFSRSLWNTIGMVVASVPLFLLYWAEDYAVVMILAYQILNAAELSGQVTNILEVAPSHSGMIASEMVFLSNLLAFTGPIYAGLIIQDEMDIKEWWKVFATGAALNVFGAVAFILFGTTKAQSWDNDE